MLLLVCLSGACDRKRVTDGRQKYVEINKISSCGLCRLCIRAIELYCGVISEFHKYILSNIMCLLIYKMGNLYPNDFFFFS